MLGIQLHNGEWSSKNVESVRESMLRKNYKAEKQNANSDWGNRNSAKKMNHSIQGLVIPSIF